MKLQLIMGHITTHGSYEFQAQILPKNVKFVLCIVLPYLALYFLPSFPHFYHSFNMSSSEIASSLCKVIELPSHGRALAAAEDVPAGTVVLQTAAEILDHPTIYTVQCSETEHMNVSGGFQYTAHACDPACRIEFLHEDDKWTLNLITLRDVKTGMC